jgi:phosphate:Na+ symporter
MTDGSDLDIVGLSVGLLGGLAIFLYGLDKLTEGLKVVAGDRMRNLLARMTNNRFKAVAAGATITAVIQSSSVTTVLVVGFISAGLMSLSQSIGVIMGASIGTTITAQIIAFKVTKFSLVLVAVGFATQFISKRDYVKQYGHMLLGLGLVFFGMELMKQAMSPLQAYEPFAETMKTLDNPLLAVLFAALFTGLIQSSSATTGVIIALASGGFLTLETGIPMIFGANIGTCVTAVLASIGKPREAVRAAMVHVLFNTAGVLVWIGLIPQLAEFIRWISPAAEGLSGAALLQADTPRQIANAHTVFNVGNTLLFIGFTPWIARIVELMVPDRKIAETKPADTHYLENLLVHTPSLALDVVRMEMARLGASTLAIVRAARDPVLQGSAEELASLRKMDEEVDELHAAMISYLGRLSRENLSEPQSHRISEYIAAANYFENIGDMVETNLVDAGLSRDDAGLVFSDSTRKAFENLFDKVEWSIERTTEALASDDAAVAREVKEAKTEITKLADGLDSHLSDRLRSDEPNRLETFRLESEIVEVLRRLYYFAKRIAKGIEEYENEVRGDSEK